MPTDMTLTSLQNPRVKRAVRLRDRRDRDRDQLMLIEGYRELLRAQEAGYPMEELFVCPELFQGENEPALIAALRERGVQVYETTAPVFRKLAYRDRPEGLLAVAPQVHRRLEDLALGAPPFLLVAESIEKPGNLGTILRSADAAGVDGLILCDRCTDLFNPNVVRASIGTLFSVPVAEASTEETVAWLRGRGVRMLVATPHADAVFTDTDMNCPLAVVVGSEQYGLSDRWLREGDLAVRIPMCGRADSLNVATATTLLLYEALRQRHLARRLAGGDQDDG